MANAFVLTDSRLKLHMRVTSCFGECGINSGFLWIGGNRLGRYQMDHFRGPKKSLSKFRKSVTKSLKECQKNRLLNGFAITTDKLGRYVGEDDVSISESGTIPPKLPLDHHTEKIKIKKDCSDLFSSLKKTKYGRFLPVLLKDIPHKRKSYVYIVVNNKDILLKTPFKRTMNQCVPWITRFIRASEKI